tara:strand:+ start:1167 stop:1565 length:399 start_codon:yes stop_codon:yes gene_type:complete
MSQEKNLGGRPQIVLDEEQIKEVELKAETMTCEQIADRLGHSTTTFQEIRKKQPEVSTAYKRGRAKVIDEIASSLIKNAKAGCTSSQIFFLKTQAGWKDIQHLETKDTTEAKLPPLQININVNEKPAHRLND